MHHKYMRKEQRTFTKYVVSVTAPQQTRIKESLWICSGVVLMVCFCWTEYDILQEECQDQVFLMVENEA